MKKKLILILFFISINLLFAQPFDVSLSVVTNDGTDFVIDVIVDGYGGQTISSANFDIVFDNSKLIYNDFSNFIFTGSTGYTLPFTNVLLANPTTVRISVFGLSVNPSNEIVVDDNPVAWARLHFQPIDPSASTNLFIAPPPNASISLFEPIGQYVVSGQPVPLILNNINDQPLPVELSSFSVNTVEGVKAQLNWETATEVNNYGFEIERSIVSEEDAFETESYDWEKVSFVEGHGNSNSTKIYSFTDKNLVGGSKFVYRLKQIDIDGTFEYSDVVEIEVLPTKYELY